MITRRKLSVDFGFSDGTLRIWNLIEEGVKKGVLVPNKRRITASELFAEDYVTSAYE
jgi:hypothetical protein